MNIIKRLYRAFKYGAHSPLTRPENAWAYQQNNAPRVQLAEFESDVRAYLASKQGAPRPVKNVTPRPLAIE